MQQTLVTAPPSQSTPRLWIRAVATTALIVAFAGDGFRYLIGWTGYAVLCLALVAACVVLFVRHRPAGLRGPWPWSAVAYPGFAALSLLWSPYPGGSALMLVGVLSCTVVGAFCALVLSWTEFFDALAAALRWVLGVSLVFELFVSLVIRQPVFPLAVETPDRSVLLGMWSRNALFTGDRIQGIVGNANLLGIIATFGIILFALQLIQRRRMPAAIRVRTMSTAWQATWLGIAVLTFALTRSGTMIIALAVAAAVALVVVLLRRASLGAARVRIYLGAAAVLVVGTTLAVTLRDTLFGLLGKSSDLTGRGDIWASVIERANEHPIRGWGFSSPWIPWSPYFETFVVRNGAQQLQAHNAWLDVWMQLGIIGVVLFAALVISTLWRTWFMAVDRPRVDLRTDQPYSALALVPLLFFVILVVQSASESRMLIESGWVLVIAFAVASKRRPLVDAWTELSPEATEEPRRVRTRGSRLSPTPERG